MRNRTRCLFLSGVLAAWCAAESTAQVVLNEVAPNPVGTQDELWEFVELYGRPGMSLDGYAIGVLKGGRDVNNDGNFDAVPEIDEAWSLDGLTIGANGFLVLYNDTGAPSQLVVNNLINPAANTATFTATHIIPPSGTDAPGKIENDGSTTLVLVRRRPGQTLDEFSDSIYDANYAFHKDVRHDVNADGNSDFGTEVNLIGTGEPARMVEHYQVVDDLAWSHENGKEYHRTPGHEISETPGFNPDAASRLRYYLRNPQRGYFSQGTTGEFSGISSTSVADEAFIYGELFDTFFGSPNFFKYINTTDPVSGYIQTKTPTNMSAARYGGSCDPEPDDVVNPACTPESGGAFEFTDVDFNGFKLTAGSFNDHPTDPSLAQFRVLHGDFNFDGRLNQIDRRLIEERVGATLDDTVPDLYDPSPNPGDEVVYDRFLRQGPEFQLVLMMREMDMDDGPGGVNAAAVTADDLSAFLAACSVCGNAGTPPAVRITEYMYSGNGGEFVEFTNLSGAAVDMTGWSYDDNSRQAGSVDLTAFGIVAPGESVILTEDDRAFFAVEWDVVGVKIIGISDHNLSREDEVNLYDNAGNLADRLTYGDQTFAPGTIRTQNFSGWPCAIGIGANDISDWRLSLAGDAQASHVAANGDVGNPGSFVVDNCATSPPVGACCIAGACVAGPTITQAYCVQSDGIYMGDGVACGSVTCPQPSGAEVRITEYMYEGAGGEFIEITNLDTVAVNLVGWSFDDSGRTPGIFSIGALGTLQPGETGIITDSDAPGFRAHWGLPPAQDVVGDLGAGGAGHNLSRNDEINIYDSALVLVDRLRFGDVDFPGTVRAQDVSAWPCSFAIAQNDVSGWVASAVDDAQDSVDAGGAIGNPGNFVPDDCEGEPTGACCNQDGSCDDDLTQSACEANEGLWQGGNTACATVECPQPGGGVMRITEWAYQGASGEFVEFTNVGTAPVEMTNWSFDDDGAIPGATLLTAFGTVDPGESVILTEAAAATFATNWSLTGVSIIGGNTNNLSRNDQINLYDANGVLVDRLSYGDEVGFFPGSIRTNTRSGWTCHENLGANDVYGWQLSEVADAQGSHASVQGAIGNPGSYAAVSCSLCATCMADADGNATINTSDIPAFVNCALGNTPIDDCHCADMDESGAVTGSDVQAFANELLGDAGACP
ncbi:MAG TPA: lamin tail domain-containing protein [Phycisphaerae bacterium]|nr:lamin tail domain-containing protein [Phycisphaerae bacterium]